MGWAHVGTVVGVLGLGAVAVGGNADTLLLVTGKTSGIILLVGTLFYSHIL